jgi:hypothetical protein
VSGEPPETAAGHCNDCGEHTDAVVAVLAVRDDAAQAA